MVASPVTPIGEREFVFTLPDHPPTLQERAIIMYFMKKYKNHTAEMREQLFQRCKDDAAFFINMFGYTFDPRESIEDHDIPFILYEFQEDHIEFMNELIRDGRSGMIEKTRDMGVTWVTLAWLVHRWIFTDGFQSLIGSRKEDLVDNWTRDSHFGKIEYFIDMLPKWILPKGFSLAHHRLKLKLINPETGNVIIGESANSQFSRQGRYTVIFFDEAAFWDDLGSALRAAAQASPTRLLVSTPGGPPESNAFAAERFADPARFRILTLHWSRHPLKTPEWYAEQREQMSDEDAAQ
jgi:phage terminase large subunit